VPGVLSERNLSLLGLFAIAGMAVAVSIWKPGTTALLPPCPFHAITGLFCPGCGSTRMLYYLVHGQIGRSFRQNPLAFIALPFVVAKLVVSVLPAAWQVQFRFRFLRSPYWAYGVLVVVIAYAVLRSIPYWPACTLAPGGC